jgi:hypothetical protein
MATQLEQIRDLLQALVGTAGIDDLDTLLTGIDADTGNIATALAGTLKTKPGALATPIKATGTGGVVTANVNPGAAWFLHEVRVKLSAAVAATLTGIIDDVDNAVYDVPLFSVDMTASASYVFHPASPIPMETSQFNAAINPGAQTVGIKVFYSLA